MRIVLLATLLVAGILFAAGTDKRDPREYFFTQTFGDLPEEMQHAARYDEAIAAALNRATSADDASRIREAVVEARKMGVTNRAA